MRIVSGFLGGRAFDCPKGDGTRPTTDRVRESLFSILGDVEGVTVLDLFAGTGALGFEALSRGAKRVVFVEKAHAALVVLRNNIKALGLSKTTTVIAKDARRATRDLDCAERIDLVFLDPPYDLWDTDEVQSALANLLARQCLSEQVCVVAEHRSNQSAPVLPGLVANETREYGDTSVTFFEAASLPQL